MRASERTPFFIDIITGINMIFQLNSKDDKWLEEVYKSAIDDLGKFFKINWAIDPPKIYLVKDRKTIDTWWGKTTKRWLEGWTSGNVVYLLSYEDFDNESENKFDEKKYEGKLRHELAHLYFGSATGRYGQPVWLKEGIAQYFGNDKDWRAKPEKFNMFLDCFSEHKDGIYGEAWYAVELLINKYGSEKLLSLLSEIKKERPEEKEFEKIFSDIYGFQPRYSEFDSLLKTA